MGESVNKKRQLYSAYGVLCFAAVLLYIAAGLFSNAREKLENWERSSAVVVDFESVRVGGRGTHARYRSYPLVEFTANDGRHYKVRSQESNKWLKCRHCQQVDVLYPEGKPRGAVVYGFWAFFRWALVLALVGGAQAVFGAAMLVYYYRREPRVKALLDWFGQG